MSKLNKQQKIIIGGGIAAILVVIITTVFIVIGAMNDGDSDKKDADGSIQESQVAGNETIGDKESEEASKDEESSKDEDDSTEESSSEEDTTEEGTTSTGSGTDVGTGEDNDIDQNTGNEGSSGNSGNSGSQTETIVLLESKILGTYITPNPNTTRVSVHDPSIEYDHTTGEFYIFGSHKAFAKTSNMVTWSYVSGMNGSATFHTIFAESSKWSAKGGTQGNSSYMVDGNLWAPDVIYNKDMKKWCMYMSVNGDNHYSSIAMATADKITGPYAYVGTVVYSGFKTVSDLKLTDYEKATGSTSLPSYANSWGTNGTNAIDPCVLYDKDGQLWMVYGSWFGGIYMLKLDNSTGLRDYSYTYASDNSPSDGRASDPYLGQRISGGYGGTGEGPYIVWDEEAGYYYLYLSYCGLSAADPNFSGYHMRLFRSKNIDGPYTDAAGNNALRVNNKDDQSVKGIKIMGNYYFSSLATNTCNGKNGYMSPGHNSAIIDNDGNRYVVYHTRFNLGNEWHQVRVHQQFVNEDGWLVTAPYEYLGSKICETGYTVTDIVGTYEIINHGNDATTALIGMLDTKEVTLNKDGSVTGDYTGTWSQKAGTYYATLVLDGITYKGVFYLQYDESTSKTPTMTFSLIGSNNLAIWGSKRMYVEEAETGNVIGSYTFDDASGLGKDSAGKVGAATVNGCTSANDTERGKVLSFDGTDDYVKLPNAATKNLKGYTIMMWVKPTADNMWTRIFDLGDSTSKYMFVTLKSSSNGIRFAQTVNGNSVDQEQMIDSDAISLNKWTHIALTVNATTKKATLYVNGKNVGTTLMTAYPAGYSGGQNYLGKSQYTDPYFKGYMDSVYIFNYALSASEVTTYMNK